LITIQQMYLTMGKRSNFERNPRDYYQTPENAILPLLGHLPKTFDFTEICAGDGALVRHLEAKGGKCLLKCDIEPQSSDIQKIDMFSLRSVPAMPILNPPWNRKILHPLIDHLLTITNDFWLLFDANWMFTRQSKQYLQNCESIVTVGRVIWIPGTKMASKDDCAWYRFTKDRQLNTKFFGHI
jgi:hypothetical protein